MYNYCCLSKAVIYQIHSPSMPGLRYIGATAQDLKSRFIQHLYAYNRWTKGKGPYVTAFEIFSRCNDFQCIPLEAYPCESRSALEKRERAWIKAFPCLNRHYNGEPAWTRDERGNFLSKYAAPQAPTAEEPSPNVDI